MNMTKRLSLLALAPSPLENLSLPAPSSAGEAGTYAMQQHRNRVPVENMESVHHRQTPLK